MSNGQFPALYKSLQISNTFNDTGNTKLVDRSIPKLYGRVNAIVGEHSSPKFSSTGNSKYEEQPSFDEKFEKLCSEFAINDVLNENYLQHSSQFNDIKGSSFNANDFSVPQLVLQHVPNTDADATPPTGYSRDTTTPLQGYSRDDAPPIGASADPGSINQLFSSIKDNLEQLKTCRRDIENIFEDDTDYNEDLHRVMAHDRLKLERENAALNDLPSAGELNVESRLAQIMNSNDYSFKKQYYETNNFCDEYLAEIDKFKVQLYSLTQSNEIEGLTQLPTTDSDKYSSNMQEFASINSILNDIMLQCDEVDLLLDQKGAIPSV